MGIPKMGTRIDIANVITATAKKAQLTLSEMPLSGLRKTGNYREAQKNYDKNLLQKPLINAKIVYLLCVNWQHVEVQCLSFDDYYFDADDLFSRTIAE